MRVLLFGSARGSSTQTLVALLLLLFFFCGVAVFSIPLTWPGPKRVDHQQLNRAEDMRELRIEGFAKNHPLSLVL